MSKYNPTRDDEVPNKAFFVGPNFPAQRMPFHGRRFTASMKSETFFSRFQYSSISFWAHSTIEAFVDEVFSSLQLKITSSYEKTDNLHLTNIFSTVLLWKHKLKT